ncbi:MAG: hypothetical protein LUF82_02830 [Clostridia bacterium]|nr:hypothetical protein [Clostridia bacterium]
MNRRTQIADFLKEKKKLILVILLIILLAAAVFIFYGDKEEQTSTASSMTETESKIANVLSAMDGVGEVEVLVTETEGEITGVVIVCEGADSILVRNNILNAVSTALNINKNIIAIYSM